MSYDDYRIEFKVKNNRILAMIESAGFTTIAEFCRAHGLQQSAVGEMVNMKRSPLNKHDMWSQPAIDLADALNCEVLDLFSEEQQRAELESNKRFVTASREQAEALTHDGGMLKQLALEQLPDVIDKVMQTTTDRRAEVIKMRFGLAPYDRVRTLEEVAKTMGLSRERIRQMEAKALRDMRAKGKPAAKQLAREMDLDHLADNEEAHSRRVGKLYY